MSVSNGQVANETTFNNAFLSKSDTTASNTTTGIIGMANVTDVNSGNAIVNTQRLINEVADSDGTVGEGDATRKTYSSNNVVANGDSRKTAIGKIDAEFDITTGHDHDGINSKKVSAANLDNFNNFIAQWQTFALTGVTGTSTDVSTPLTAKTPGGDSTTAGVITTGTFNDCELRNSLTGDYLEDAQGQRVYARLTEAASVWTLSYYTNEAGVETAYSFSSTDIQVYFREVFTMETRPTIQNDGGMIGSLDLTADIVDASLTNRGVINTTTQSFAGDKTFSGAVSVDALSVTNPSGGVINSVGAPLVLLGDVDGVSQDLFLEGNNVQADAATNIILNSAGNISMNATTYIAANSKNIKNVADPVDPQDAATKNYVDTALTGFAKETTLGFTLVDNQVTPAAIYTKSITGLAGIKIVYGIQRGVGNSRHADFWISSDGTSVSYVDGPGTELGSTGITLTADISGGSFRLLYTSTSTGTAGTMNLEASLIPA